MSSNDQTLSGPDFAAGIDDASLADGAKQLGHANGEAVLLVKRGADVFAIGATCSHYGGPLAEGLVEGDTVRCPWHHACFSLRTGEVLHAPAFNPVPCYEVKREGGKLVVLGKKPAPKHEREGKTPSSIVIVGAGAAGNAAAETLRNSGYRGPVTMLGADASVPYDRPNISKDYLAGNAPEEWIPLRGPEFYAENEIALRVSTEVARIDPSAKTVELVNGEKLSYGALLLATGAEPIHLTPKGHDLLHVRYLRTLADSRAIIAALDGKKRALIVGTGFIGLEVAASLRARGLEVEVAGLDKLPLARVLGEELGREIQKIHESHGVRFHLGTSVKAIETSHVELEDGARISADLVVIGVGVRPSTKLAEAAGLTVDRGVVVDRTLQTSQEGIYAAGDIARFPDGRSGHSIRVEHWAVAQRQGKTAALNMLGDAKPFDAVPFFWSAHYDVTVSYVGHADEWDRIDVAGDIGAHDCAVAYRKNGRTLAVATMGRDHVSLEAEVAMERGDEATLAKLVPAK